MNREINTTKIARPPNEDIIRVIAINSNYDSENYVGNTLGMNLMQTGI